MNIFYLCFLQKECARMHVDKHVVKMILESCQLLCTVHHLCPNPNSSYVPPYKKTHMNHPCSIWLRESAENYKWLVELALELCYEYTYRFSKGTLIKIHKCQPYIEELKNNIPDIPNTPFTQPRQAMPEMYKGTDSILAYRDYYFFEKHRMLKWTKRETPVWIEEMRAVFEE